MTLLAGEEGVAGWIEPEGGAGRVWGLEAVTVAVGPYRQRLAARAFAQANARVTGDILQMITDVVGSSATGGAAGRADAPARVAVELFAGSGTLSQALWSAGFEVHAYELDAAARPAFEAARAALGRRGTWSACDLGGGLVLPAPPTPEVVLLDPPRTGAAEVMPWVRASGARIIAYMYRATSRPGSAIWRRSRPMGAGSWSACEASTCSLSGHQEVVAVARRVT
ncbi:MAG: hypothetical protein U1F43_11540 [Myxococcota bacterium]